jgi:dUTP pyrophosphatase
MTALRVIRLPNADGLPQLAYQTAGASGFDLYAAIDAPIEMHPGDTALIPVGFAFDIPTGFEGQIRARSGLSSRVGLTVLNGPGTIDSDFRGEVKVITVNHGRAPVTVERGMRFAQMIIAPVERVRIEEVDAVSGSQRGAGGFGSTGR